MRSPGAVAESRNLAVQNQVGGQYYRFAAVGQSAGTSEFSRCGLSSSTRQERAAQQIRSCPVDLLDGAGHVRIAAKFLNQLL